MQETRPQTRTLRFETSRDHGSDMTAGSIFFIGNATVLIRFAGFTILTDPTFIHMHDTYTFRV